MQEIQVLEEVSSDPNELKKQFYIESYGCAMNFSDSEIIGSILTEHGFNLMDIGISTLKGEPNHGLVNFKRNLGFTESTKLEMVWQNKLGKDVKL